jgi:hypothetical protein
MACYAGIAIAASAVAFLTFSGVSAWAGKSGSEQSPSAFSTESSAPTPGEARLVIADADLDLGTPYEADHYEHSFDVKNVTDQAITVAYWQRSCSCADVSPAGPVVFESGETKRLTAGFKLIPKKWSDDPIEGVLFSVRIYPTIHENDEDVKIGAWEFHCRILPTIHFNPPVLNLGVHSEKEAAIEGSADVVALLDVRSVECTGSARWDVEVQSPNESTKGYRLKVRSKGKLQPEEIRETFTVTTVRENGEPLPIKELQVVGKIVRDVVADPPQIQFGRQACGKSGTETVSLRSLTGGSFEVSSLLSDSEDLKVIPIEDDAKAKYSLSMAFVEEGKQSAIAKFAVRESDGTEYEVVVPVRYYGVKSR